MLPVLLWLAGGGFVISKLSFIIRNGSFPPQSANCSVKVLYRGEKKSLQILLSYSQAGPGRKAKQGQEEISRNHVPTFFLGSVCMYLSGLFSA